MPYPKKLLNDYETVALDLHPHWWSFAEPAAALVGWLSSRAWDRRFLKALATFAGGSLVVFAVGLPWLAAVLGLTDPLTVLEAGFLPFVVGGIIKALIAAALLPAAWWEADALQARRSGRAGDDATGDPRA